ncbi:MAG: hypothetical protein KKH12_02625 [Gammaproteobacteria bacterium]|nr:hypothetical protein [Gammaproteobacteria bacterium]MBU1480547.1 hypothetical protein [Gammaproteobacteria bacterium]
MSESENAPLNWDIQLNFDNLEITEEAPAPTKKIPPRKILGEKFPKILERVDLLWGSLELHKYLEQIIFSDRSKREGFPNDVLQALGEIHVEHKRILKLKKLINDDIWDL